MWMRSFGMLVGMLPLTIAGLGVREGALLTVMVPYGINPSGVVAFSLVRMAISLIIAGLGGVLELFEVFFPKRVRSNSV